MMMTLHEMGNSNNICLKQPENSGEQSMAAGLEPSVQEEPAVGVQSSKVFFPVVHKKKAQ